MPDTDSEQWRIFYAITPQQIADEIAAAEADFPAFFEREKLPRDLRRTPEGRARDEHKFLVMTSVYSRLEHVLPEHRVHLAHVAANRVADSAQSIAHGNNRLKELGDAMDAIRRREGLATGDWMLGQGPEDYQALVRESEAIYDRIAETIVPEILRRYQMPELADLYERDRRRFAIEAEIGLRVEKRPTEVSTEIISAWDTYFEKEYGADALAEVRRRAAEIRRREGRS